MPLTLFCRRGSILSTTIFVYAAAAPVNGFMGGSLYAKQGGLYALALYMRIAVLLQLSAVLTH